jgi:hypothetical protein
MSMKSVLPPDFKPPFWATRDFRRLIIGVVMGLAVIGVMVFQIAPKLSERPGKAAKAADPNAFVPKPAVPGAPAEMKFEGMLEKVKDGTPLDDQDAPYQYLVRSLSRMDAALVAKEAKSVEYQYYSKMPVEMRGQTAKILALFLTSNPIRVDAAPGGVNFIHRTYLMDLRGEEGYVVDLLEAPPDLPQRSLVSMDAVFLKLGTYEAKKGQVQAPLFVGRNLRLVKERMAADPVAGLSGWVVAGVGAFLMLLILGITSRMFRKPSGPKGPAVSLESLKS